MATQELFPGIISSTGRLGGEAFIKGTRVPVALVLGKLAGGMKLEELLDEFDLTEEQVRVALAYAEHLVEARDQYVSPT